MQIQLPPHIEQAIIAAAKSGDYERVANELAAAVRENRPEVIMMSPSGSDPIERLPEDIDIDQLVAEQGVKPFDASVKPDPNLWPADESADDFIACIREHRNQDSTEPACE